MIIGIGGEKESGKNTAASLFVKEYGYTEWAFAKVLKEAVSWAFAIPMSQLNEGKDQLWDRSHVIRFAELSELIQHLRPYYKITEEQHRAIYNKASMKCIRSPREMLQFIGTDVIRQCVDKDFWVKVTKEALTGKDNVVITDVRFENERQTVRELGGKMIRMVRKTGNTDNHPSETSLGSIMEYDQLFANNGTIVSLHAELVDWYNHSRGGHLGEVSGEERS